MASTPTPSSDASEHTIKRSISSSSRRYTSATLKPASDASQKYLSQKSHLFSRSISFPPPASAPRPPRPKQTAVQTTVGVGNDTFPAPPGYTLRTATFDDVSALATIAYHSFTRFNISAGIPPHIDFESVEHTERELGTYLLAEAWYGVSAVHDASGSIVGGGFLHYTGEGVHSIDNVFVDPDYANGGVAKAIMNALVQQAKRDATTSIRLMEVSNNIKAFCLYAKLDFNPVDCVSYFEGMINVEKANSICSNLGINLHSEIEVREMEDTDVKTCAKLFKSAMGYDRELELQDQQLSRVECAWVAEKDGSLVAFTTGYDAFGYTVAISEEALVNLFMYVSQYWLEENPPTIHICARLYPRLNQWALGSGLTLIRHLWVMVHGEYQYPQKGFIYCPNVVH